MRITKQIAENIAEKLTEKKVKNLEDQKQKIKDLVTELIREKTPNEVVLLSKKQPSFFTITDIFRFDTEDFKWEYFQSNEKFPTTENHYEITKEENKKLFNLLQKREKIKNEIRQLRKEIEQALINLKTFKRVETEFPEAFKFLPKNGSTALVVNVDHIRKQLND